ncbi:hypothetical protein [Hyperthermus butylicus]|uniref:Uncharacterized protein n=1 Tax=Hyperthermus butylicus (strain DSM 5456 / JCM 9403 / PLM1-5) TaxID=415426 RepID=A2BJR4_HYPBU|nr:hypothetical protein [Hyperthermus butylicus]ABM80225.1 hypothetical protein Hbut_0353 [Hyperthermus butylicus DSM 5456]
MVDPAARVVNLLRVIYDILGESVGFPRLALGASGSRFYRVRARIRVPVAGIVARRFIGGSVEGFNVMVLRGAIHVEPLLATGFPTIVSIGARRLYNAAYSSIALMADMEAYRRILSAAGLWAREVREYAEALAEGVREWFESRQPPSGRLQSVEYGVRRVTENAVFIGPQGSRTCSRMIVSGHVSFHEPTGILLRVDCDGELVLAVREAASPVELEGDVVTVLEELYDMVREDLEDIEKLRETIHATARKLSG